MRRVAAVGLSNSPAWEDPVIDIVSVVSKSRSYCYLDERRVHFEEGTLNVPDDDDIRSCPSYDQ